MGDRPEKWFGVEQQDHRYPERRVTPPAPERAEFAEQRAAQQPPRKPVAGERKP